MVSRGRHNQSGQAIVEFILITTVLVSIAAFVSKTLRDNNTISSLIATPWQGLSNVIEHGVWMADAAKAKKNSPFGPTRRLSLLTEEVSQ
jgi:hypothetical protein